MNKLPDFISLEEYRGLSLAANSSQRSRLYNAFAQYCYDTTSLELKKNTAIHSCRAAKKFFVIDEAGEVFACEILGTPLGNLRNDNYDLKRIAKNAETKKLRNTIIKNRCYCQWPCAAACNAYLNIVTYPKILARFFPSRKTI